MKKITDAQIVDMVIRCRSECGNVMGPTALRPFSKFIERHLGIKITAQGLQERIDKLIRAGQLTGLRTWDCPGCLYSNLSDASLIRVRCHNCGSEMGLNETVFPRTVLASVDVNEPPF